MRTRSASVNSVSGESFEVVCWLEAALEEYHIIEPETVPKIPQPSTSVGFSDAADSEKSRGGKTGEPINVAAVPESTAKVLAGKTVSYADHYKSFHSGSTGEKDYGGFRRAFFTGKQASVEVPGDDASLTDEEQDTAANDIGIIPSSPAEKQVRFIDNMTSSSILPRKQVNETAPNMAFDSAAKADQSSAARVLPPLKPQCGQSPSLVYPKPMATQNLNSHFSGARDWLLEDRGSASTAPKTAPRYEPYGMRAPGTDQRHYSKPSKKRKSSKMSDGNMPAPETTLPKAEGNAISHTFNKGVGNDVKGKSRGDWW